MSTLENALKQQYTPLRTLHPFPFPNHADESSMENWSELRYAARDADDEASTPELRVRGFGGLCSPVVVRADLPSATPLRVIAHLFLRRLGARRLDHLTQVWWAKLAKGG